MKQEFGLYRRASLKTIHKALLRNKVIGGYDSAESSTQ